MIDISTDLDLFEKQTIRITRKAQDTSELTSKESEFSKTFLGPASRKNLLALDNYGLITANSSFNPHKGIACIWTINSAARFEGRLEVRKVVYEGGDPKSIEFVFYGKQRTLANIIGVDRFSEIDWSDYDHSLTYANVTSSWSGSLLAGDLLYPLIDSRQNYFIGPSDLDIEGNISNESHPILLSDLKPAILFSAFLTTIFSNYDLTLTIGTELAAYIEGLYVLPNRLSGSSENPETIDDNLSKVSDLSSNEITQQGGESLIEFATTDQDPNSQWSAGEVYTALVDGVYDLSGFLFVRLNGPQTPFNAGQYRVEARVNETDVVATWQTSAGFEDDFINLYLSSQQVTLESGDEVKFFLVRVLINGFFQGQDCEVFDLSDINFIEILSPVNQLGGNVSLASQMPDDKVVEWLSNFFKSWNLQIIVDDLNPTAYALNTLNEWNDEGSIRDWSKRVDLKNLVYSKRNVYREVNYNYTESESSTQQTFKNVTGGRAYGELRLRPDIEFGESKLKIENPCNIIAPSVLFKVNSNGETTQETVNLGLHKSLDGEGSPVAEQWLLFYFNVLANAINSNYYLQDGFSGVLPSAILQTTYPRISSIQGLFPSEDSNTLTFALENPQFGTVPQNTAYKTHWQDAIINQYATLSRKLEAVEIYLTTEQFINYRLNDEIFIEGDYWRISEIRHDTDQNNKAIATLQSSRTNDSPKDFTVSPGGKINFTGDPTQIDLTSTGAITQDGSYYIGSPLIKIKPNLNSYALARANITTEIITQINEIGGRFRTWNEES